MSLRKAGAPAVRRPDALTRSHFAEPESGLSTATAGAASRTARKTSAARAQTPLSPSGSRKRSLSPSRVRKVQTSQTSPFGPLRQTRECAAMRASGRKRFLDGSFASVQRSVSRRISRRPGRKRAPTRFPPARKRPVKTRPGAGVGAGPAPAGSAAATRTATATGRKEKGPGFPEPSLVASARSPSRG